MEREGESFISWMEGQESCNGGRREKSKAGTSVEDGSGETKAWRSEEKLELVQELEKDL